VRRVLRLLVTANVVPSSPSIVILMMEALCSSETSVPTTTTLRNIPEEGILHSHGNENLKYYLFFLPGLDYRLLLSTKLLEIKRG
jgi:hypothetical protein